VSLVSQVCGPLDDQAPALIIGDWIGPFFAAHSFVVGVPTTTILARGSGFGRASRSGRTDAARRL
jgi:hypothetical protein